MAKKNLTIIITIALFVLIAGGIVIFYSTNKNEVVSQTPPTTQSNTGNTNDLNLPTKGNDYVITTKSKTKLRVVNEYSTIFLTADKNLLIMFGSWCSHCQVEIAEIQKILEKYNGNEDVNIVLIAHEYKDTITNLQSLVENEVNFGDREVLIDLGRVIRKQIDPEAGSVPVSYVVDKKGNILVKNDEAITLEKATQMLEK